MQKNKSPAIEPDHPALQKLLQLEQQNLARWLHDELGQNLVAIKSFATAIIEQNQQATDDTLELADIIKQAADQAYRSTYDLMQELRAQDNADLPVDAALAACLKDARLKEKGIDYQLDIDINPAELDKLGLAIILRSMRSFINFSLQCSQVPTLSISLRYLSQAEGSHTLELKLSHRGELDMPPKESSGLTILRKRIEAIGGETQLYTDNKQKLDLTLKLGQILANRGSIT